MNVSGVTEQEASCRSDPEIGKFGVRPQVAPVRSDGARAHASVAANFAQRAPGYLSDRPRRFSRLLKKSLRFRREGIFCRRMGLVVEVLA